MSDPCLMEDCVQEAELERFGCLQWLIFGGLLTLALLAALLRGCNGSSETPAATLMPTIQATVVATAPTLKLPLANFSADSIPLSGEGTPGTELELFNNGISIGKTKVGDDGKWAFSTQSKRYYNDFQAKFVGEDSKELLSPIGRLVLPTAFAALAINGAPQLGKFALDASGVPTGTVSWAGKGEPATKVQLWNERKLLDATDVDPQGNWKFANSNLNLPSGDYKLIARMIGEQDKLLAESDPATITIPNLATAKATDTPKVTATAKATAAPKATATKGEAKATAVVTATTEASAGGNATATIAPTKAPEATATKGEVKATAVVTATTEASTGGKATATVAPTEAPKATATKGKVEATTVVTATTEASAGGNATATVAPTEAPEATAELLSAEISNLGANGTITNGIAAFSGTASPSSTIEITLSNGTVLKGIPVNADGSWSEIATKLPTGEYTATIRAVDKDGNSGSEPKTLTFTVIEQAEPTAVATTAPTAEPTAAATTAPTAESTTAATTAPTAESTQAPATASLVAEITNRSSDGTLSADVATFSGKATPGTTIEIALSNGTVIKDIPVNADGTWSYNSDALRGGEYIATVSSIGQDGKVVGQPIALPFKVEQQSGSGEPTPTVAAAVNPDLVIVKVDPVANAPEIGNVDYGMSGKGEPNKKLIILENGKQVGSATVRPDGTWSCKCTLPPGEHTLIVQNADNPAVVSAPTTFVVENRTETYVPPVAQPGQVYQPIICDGSNPPGQIIGTVYKVALCETFQIIANRLGTTTAELLVYNPQLTNPRLIYEGQFLNIPPTAGCFDQP